MIFGIFLCIIFFPQHSWGISSAKECNAVEGAHCCESFDSSKEKAIGYCSQPDPENPGSGSLCCIAGSSSTPASSFDYTPLETIPGQGATKDLPSYLTALFNFTLGAVGIAALLMAIIGGFYYVTSAGNSSRVEKGKELITDALLGIAVAFLSWLVLYVINPDLVNVNLDSLSVLEGDYEEDIPSGETPRSPLSPPGGIVPAGSCGGLTPLEKWNVSDQCKLTSSSLATLLSCMQDSGLSGTVTAVTSKTVLDNKEKLAACCESGYSRSVCGHSANSCHYGCGVEPGQSHAADYGISQGASDDQLCNIATIAQKTCKSGLIRGPKNITCPSGAHITKTPKHETHLHISTGACNN